jgi:hypothetical protein
LVFAIDLHHAHVTVDLLANQCKVGRFQFIRVSNNRVQRLPRSALKATECSGRKSSDISKAFNRIVASACDIEQLEVPDDLGLTLCHKHI